MSFSGQRATAVLDDNPHAYFDEVIQDKCEINAFWSGQNVERRKDRGQSPDQEARRRFTVMGVFGAFGSISGFQG